MPTVPHGPVTAPQPQVMGLLPARVAHGLPHTKPLPARPRTTPVHPCLPRRPRVHRGHGAEALGTAWYEPPGGSPWWQSRRWCWAANTTTGRSAPGCWDLAAHWRSSYSVCAWTDSLGGAVALLAPWASWSWW